VRAVVFDGGPPSWINQLDDAELVARIGPETLRRGHAYAIDGAVLDLSTSDGGRLILASVDGNARSPYSTLVSAGNGSGAAGPDWHGDCSCPMRVDCKHVAAVILKTRQLLSFNTVLSRAELTIAPPRRAPAPAPTPAPPALPVPRARPPLSGWETQLAGLVRDDPPPPAAVPLGLLVEIAPNRPGRYAAVTGQGRPPVRIRLRPVVAGRSGAWVKTGASWRDLEDGRVGRFDPDQREAVLAVMVRFRAHSATSYYSYSEPSVYLDDLGPGLWPVLRGVLDAGVALVPAGRSDPPVQLSGPASVALDLARDDPDGPARLGALVRLPKRDQPREQDQPLEQDQLRRPGGVTLLGNPAHGMVLQQAERLLLVPFERPLPDHVSGLLATGGEITIPAAELPRFLTRYYPSLRQRVSVGSSDGSVSFPEVEPPRLAVSVAFEQGHQTSLRWEFAYPVDGRTVRVPVGSPESGAGGSGPGVGRIPDSSPGNGAGHGPDVARDRVVERALVAAARELVDITNGPRLFPQARLTGLDTATFVEQVLPRLRDRADIELAVNGTPLAYTEAPEPPVITLSATDAVPDGDRPDPDGTDWFDLGIAVSVAGESVPFRPLFTALAGGQDRLLLDTGTWFRLDRPELATLRRLIDEARELTDGDPATLRVTPWQAGLWEELVSLGVVSQQSERWTRTVGALLALDTLPRPDPPMGLRAELRPYQLAGYHWLCLLVEHGLGGILADDMGLGKTLQTLAMIARFHQTGSLEAPVLVVAPTSVVATWAGESARFTPDLNVVTITETARRSGRPLAERIAGAQVVVTSYALLRIDEADYRAQRWSVLVLDEAQFVKNHQAKTYQCARRLSAPAKLAITGTPLENSLMDLWALLSITAPGLFPNPASFTERYRKPIESGSAPELLGTLRRRIRPLMLRRTKEAIAPELPPKIEQTLDVVLEPGHRRLYDTYLQRERKRVLGLAENFQRNRFAIFRSLTVLRQLSLDASLVDAKHAGMKSAKIEALVAQLRELAAEGHRALVFSQFTGFLHAVRDRLDREGIGYCYLDGHTRDRPRRIAEFTDGDDPAFLISLKAGGFGLTLTEADYVFVLDPWWNPAAENQAIDRAHRIGQDKTVMVYRMVATDTIEEKVVALQQRKRDLFARVVDDGDLLGSALDAQDIRGLFDR